MFRDNFDVADSPAQRASRDAALQVDSLEMYAFQKDNAKKPAFDAKALGLAGDDLIDTSAERLAQSGGDLAVQAQEIGKLLKGASLEDAAEAFTDFMNENGDAMYEIAEAVKPADPLGYIADQLNQQLSGTDYQALGDKKASEVAIWTKGGDFVGGVAVGPSLEDMLRIPQN